MSFALALGACAATCLAVVLCSDIEFPTSSGAGNDAKLEIPLDLVLKFSALENWTEFQNFVDDQSLEDDPDTGIVNRFGDEVDRKAVTVPKNAVCTPELQVVELIKEKDPSLLYFPLCTRLEQCGGCCSSELLKCQPTETEMLSYMVYVSSYSSSGKFKVKEKKIVTVEKHLACKCSCAVKKEDCTKLQEYEEDNCRCRCLNTDEEKKCRAENNTKIWDPNNCVCSCRQSEQCSTGYFFNQNTCMCSEITTKRRHITDVDSRFRRGYITKLAPLPVLPLYSQNEDKLQP